MFDTYHAVFTASAQNLLGVLCSSSIVRAISHKVLFFLSITPFWAGIYQLKNWCSRPKSWQCLMSIAAIARQAQGIRAGEVIAKFAEDAYFMRVDNRVTQPPPARNCDNEATSRSADLGRNRTRA
jgi:hypothetical protein